MPEVFVENAVFSRRGALKIGLCASALLTTAPTLEHWPARNP